MVVIMNILRRDKESANKDTLVTQGVKIFEWRLIMQCMALVGIAISVACSPCSYPLRERFPNVKVQFVNTSTGWIVGPRLLRTMDGGHSWALVQEDGAGTIVTEASNFEQKIFQFINTTTGWALDARGEGVNKTTDGGYSWTETSAIPRANGEFPLQSLFFISSDEGWVVGENIYHTVDGGRHWQKISETPKEEFREGRNPRIAEGYDPAIYFTDIQRGAMARKNGTIYITRDGGRTWKRVWSSRDFLTDITFINAQDGWVVGAEGFMARTIDGGETWISVEGPSGVQLNSIFFINDKRGWAVGDSGVIIYTIDGGETWERALITQLDSPSPRLASVSFASELQGWAVGGIPYDDLNCSPEPSNVILETNDGGKTWKAIDINPR